MASKAQTEAAEYQVAEQIGGPLADRGNAVLTYGGGNSSPIYVAGDFSGQATIGGSLLTSAGGLDGFIIKYNRDGSVAWVVQALGDRDESCTALATDPQGNLYVAGTFRSTGLALGAQSYPNTNNNGTSDVFLAKIDPLGAVLWVKTGGGSDDDIVGGLAVDKFGQIFLAGSFSDVADFDFLTATSFGGFDAFLARYDGNGNLIWLEASGGDRNDYARDVVVDAFGTIFIGGGFESDRAYFQFLEIDNSENLGNSDIFLASYDSTANILWVQGGGGTGFESISALAIDTLVNDLYITGSFDNTANFGNEILFNRVARGRAGFVARLDDAGNYYWARQSQGRLIVPQDIARDQQANVLITGYFSGFAEFDCSTLVEAYSDPDSLGNATDAFVAKYSNEGDLMTVLRGGAVDASDEGRGIYVDDANFAFVTGLYSDTAQFSRLELRSLGRTDAYLAALDFVPSDCGVPTLAGRIYGDTTAACLTDEARITASGFTGEVVAWQYSYDKGQTWTTIETFDNTLETTELTVDTTFYRAIVQNCTCPNDTTAPFRKITNRPTVAGRIVGPTSVCAILPNSLTLSVRENRGRVKAWEISYDNFRNNVVAQRIPNTDPDNFNLNALNLTEQDPLFRTWFFRAVIQNGVCDSARTPVHAVRLDSCLACSPLVTRGGRAVTDRDTVCVFGDFGSVRLENFEGTILGWEVSTDNFQTLTLFPPSAPAEQLSFFNLERTTWFRARVRRPGCSHEVSEAVKITVDSCQACGFPPSVAGRISGGTTVCAITNSGSLRLENFSGDIVRWEFSFSNFRRPEDLTPDNTVWLPILNQQETQTYDRLVRATWYRAIVRSFGCKEVATAPVLVDLKVCPPCPAPPTPTVTNITDTEVTVSWQRRFNILDYELEYRKVGEPFFFKITGLRNNDPTQNIFDLPVRIRFLEPGTQYEFRVRTRCAADNVSAFSASRIVRTTCSVGGFATVDRNDLCAGNDRATVRINGSNGRVLYWESSTDGFRTIQGLESNSPNLPIANLNQSTAFRALIQDGSCPPVRSEAVLVRVLPCNPPCPKPDFLLVTNINAVSAQAFWLTLPDARYELSYRPLQALAWTTIQNIIPSTIALAGLIPGTNYEVRLRNICSDGTYSEYSEVQTFRTPNAVPVCSPPFISNVQPEITTATLAWGEVFGALGYQLRYRRSPALEDWRVLDLSQTFVTLLNLLPNNVYEVQLRTWCGDRYSMWSSSRNFRTAPYPCYIPTGLATQVNADGSVTARWNPSPHADGYQLRLTNVVTSAVSTINTTTTSQTLTGIEAGTPYLLEVRSRCGINVFSLFSPGVVFQVPATRSTVAAVAATEPLRIYPNPSTGLFTVELPGGRNEAVILSVYDLTGRMLLTRSVSPAVNSEVVELDLQDAAAGIYLLQAVTGNERTAHRLIVH
jgi:hypothetical protein